MYSRERKNRLTLKVYFDYRIMQLPELRAWLAENSRKMLAMIAKKCIFSS